MWERMCLYRGFEKNFSKKEGLSTGGVEVYSSVSVFDIQIEEMVEMPKKQSEVEELRKEVQRLSRLLQTQPKTVSTNPYDGSTLVTAIEVARDASGRPVEVAVTRLNSGGLDIRQRRQNREKAMVATRHGVLINDREKAIEVVKALVKAVGK